MFKYVVNVAPYSNAIFEKFTKEDLKPEISKEMEYSVKPFKSVDLNNLSFQYPGFKHNALSNFCLTIKAGECIGIAGESGSGKTTLSNMILGLLKPHSGEIIVDGIPINENIQDWRKQCALVSQNPFFTDDTIAKNIALGVAESAD